MFCFYKFIFNEPTTRGQKPVDMITDSCSLVRLDVSNSNVET